MNLINEKDDLFLDLTFTDRDGLAVIPTMLVYSIEDVGSGSQVKANTTVYPVAATHTLSISSAENSIIDTNEASEERRVTVTIYYLDGLSVERRKNTEFFYTITNLRMLETPVLSMEDGVHAVVTDSITITLP